jgi:hypothetical protein
MIRTSHTYAVLEVSDTAYQEVAAKLRAAGYHHVFIDDGKIDMHGIALAVATLTDKQEALRRKHGTPDQFAAACQRALGDISLDEMNAAVLKYQREWTDAGAGQANTPV